MKQRTSQILFDYWTKVRAGRPAPRRFEIEPSRIAGILPETFILERVDPQTYRYRLAGTRICEQFGREFRGANFLDTWSPSDRITMERQFRTISADAAVSLFSFNATLADGRCAAFEAIILPLVHVRPIVSRFLGAVSAIDTPAWLGSERVVNQSLLAHETIWPDGPPDPNAKAMFNTVSAREAGGPYRIVKQDRRQFRVFEGGLSKSHNKLG